MNGWIIAAAVLSALTTFIHFFAGGKTVARPLLDATDIEQTAKLTSYFCWHITTLLLAGASIGYAYAAINPDANELLYAISFFSAACALLNIGIFLRYSVSAIEMPQWTLLGGMAILGFAGAITS